MLQACENDVARSGVVVEIFPARAGFRVQALRERSIVSAVLKSCSGCDIHSLEVQFVVG